MGSGVLGEGKCLIRFIGDQQLIAHLFEGAGRLQGLEVALFLVHDLRVNASFLGADDLAEREAGVFHLVLAAIRVAAA